MKMEAHNKEPKQRKTFRDKYLAVIIAVAALHLTVTASAQLDSAKYSGINGYGFKYKRFAKDSVDIIPLSTSPHTPYRKGGIRYGIADSTLQLWTGFQWLSFAKAEQLSDSSFRVGVDTITIRAGGTGQNLATASLTANGYYSHNWENYPWNVYGIRYFQFQQATPDPTYSSREKRFMLKADSTASSEFFRLQGSLTDVDQFNDSIGFRMVSQKAGTYLYHFGNGEGRYSYMELSGNTNNPYADFLMYNGTKQSQYNLGSSQLLLIPADSTRAKLPVVASADTVIVGVNWRGSDGTVKLAKMPVSAISGGGGSADSSIFSTNYRVDTAKSNLRASIATKLTASDTTNKWLNDIRRRPGTDTVEKFKNGSWQFAYKDSIGSGTSGNFAPLFTVDSSRKYVPVIIAAGESNAIGVETNSGLSPAEKSPYAKIQILNNSNLQLEALQIGTNNSLNVNSPNTHGWELQLMKSMQAANPILNDTVYYVKIGYAGAPISALTTTYIDSAYLRLDTTIAQLIRKGYYPQIYWWHSQGINDGGIDTTVWLKTTLSYINKFKNRYRCNFPVYITELPTVSAGNGLNNTIARLPYWSGFANVVRSRGYSTHVDNTHWDSAGLAAIAKDMISLLKDTTGQRDKHVATMANKSNKGYAEFTMLKTDDDVDIAGNLQLSGDKSFTMAGGYIGYIKAFGSPGFNGVANGQPWEIKRSSASSGISSTDSYSTIFSINSSNNITASGGLTIGGNFTQTNDGAITTGGGYVGLYKPFGSVGGIGWANGQSLTFAKSSASSAISISDTYTPVLTLDNNNQATLNQYTGSSFYVNDTTNEKPLTVNRSTGKVSAGSWFGGGGLTGSGTSGKIAVWNSSSSLTTGSSLSVDSNNNFSVGSAIPSVAPLYSTGSSTWVNGFQSNGADYYKVISATSSQTLTASGHIVIVDATSGNITITLPTGTTAFAAGVGIQYIIKRVDSSGNTVTVQRGGSDTIDGGTSFTLSTNDSKTIQCTGGSPLAWVIISAIP